MTGCTLVQFTLRTTGSAKMLFHADTPRSAGIGRTVGNCSAAAEAGGCSGHDPPTPALSGRQLQAAGETLIVHDRAAATQCMTAMTVSYCSQAHDWALLFGTRRSSASQHSAFGFRDNVAMHTSSQQSTARRATWVHTRCTSALEQRQDVDATRVRCDRRLCELDRRRCSQHPQFQLHARNNLTC